MAKVIAVANQKGGCSKTLVVANLGIGGCMAGAAWYLRKKDEKDQNQD